MNFLFLSTESEPPAGYMLMKIVETFEQKFNDIHKAREYSDNIDNICIIFICVSKNYILNGVGKERKYVSHKNKYADIRLQLPYETFVTLPKEEQVSMLYGIISKAANIISLRVLDFKKEQFLSDIRDLIWSSTL